MIKKPGDKIDASSYRWAKNLKDAIREIESNGANAIILDFNITRWKWCRIAHLTNERVAPDNVPVG